MEDINRRSTLTLGLAAAAAIRENSPHYEQTMLAGFPFGHEVCLPEVSGRQN